jgi:membrane fusion protein, multidrug efflux system
MRTHAALFLGLCGILGAAACGNGGAKASLPATPPTVPATTVPAAALEAPADAAKPAVASFATAPNSTLTGTTEPRRRSTLMPVVPGIVEKVLFSEGDRVKAGAPLVTLKTEDFVLRVRQAEAGLAAAQAQFDAAQLGYDRTRGLRGKDAVSQGQLDQVEAGFKAAKAGLDNAKVMQDMARKALRDTTVTAPYDAVVVRRLISEGESALTMPPSPLAVIEQTALLDLKLQVSATDLGRMAEGTPLEVRFPATGQEVKAAVTRIVPSANPGSRTFTVIVELANEDGQLKAGLYAEAHLAASRAAEASR